AGVARQALNLLVTQTGLTTKAAVVVHSVLTAIHLARFEVGQLAQFGVEALLDRLVERRRCLQYLGRVAPRAEDVEHRAELAVDCLEQFLGRFSRLGVRQGVDQRHDVAPSGGRKEVRLCHCPSGSTSVLPGSTRTSTDDLLAVAGAPSSCQPAPR